MKKSEYFCLQNILRYIETYIIVTRNNTHMKNECRFKIIIITANINEKRQVECKMKPSPGNENLIKKRFENQEYKTGIFGKYPVAHFHFSSQGTEKPTSIQNMLPKIYMGFKPKFILMIGIAWGYPDNNTTIGDVLVSKHIQQYTDIKINENNEDPIEDRNKTYHPNEHILNIFEKMVENTSNKYNFKIKFGVLLSGSVLVDNLEFRDYIVKKYQKRHSTQDKIIGGDMESGALASEMSAEDNSNWIVVKGISDWGANKNKDITPEQKKEIQNTAANNAVQYCYDVLNSEELSTHLKLKNEVKSEKIQFERLQKMYYDRRINDQILNTDSKIIDEKLWYLSDCSAHLWEKIVENSDGDYILCKELKYIAHMHLSDREKRLHIVNKNTAINYLNLGVGNIEKDKDIISEISKEIEDNGTIYYYPLDISPKLLFENVCRFDDHINNGKKKVNIHTIPMLGDISVLNAYNLSTILLCNNTQNTIIACLGNTIGNFEENKFFDNISKLMKTLNKSTGNKSKLLIDVQFISKINENVNKKLCEIYDDELLKKFAYNAYSVHLPKIAPSFDIAKEYIHSRLVTNSNQYAVNNGPISSIPNSTTVQIVFERSKINDGAEDLILLWSSKYSRNSFELYLKEKGFKVDSEHITVQDSFNCAFYCLELDESKNENTN